MMRRTAKIKIVLIACSAVATAQSRTTGQPSSQSFPPSVAAAAANTVLAVRGKTGEVPVVQRDGRSYVDIESLARVTGAALNFEGNKVILTLPGTVQAQAPTVAAEPQTKPEEKGYTRDFLRSGVEVMTVVREWRSALENAIRTNNPVDESWVGVYRRNAESRMQLAVASATTNDDRQAVPLLQGALGMVRQLSDRFLALRSSYTYVPTDSLDNDPIDQKILTCAQGMASQAIPGGRFEDVSACH